MTADALFALRRLRTLLAASALALGASPAAAASVEIARVGEQDGRPVFALSIVGSLAAGDDAKVARVLDRALARRRFPGFLTLASDGGDSDAALGIAAIAHEYGLPILVRTDCPSGCAIIALSAWRGRLFVVESGAIGLHQCWVGPDDAPRPSMQCTQRIARALKAYGVPNGVLRRMSRTPPDGMAYLTDAELAAIGARVKHGAR